MIFLNKLSSKTIFYFYELIQKFLLSTRDIIATLGMVTNLLQILKHYVNWENVQELQLLIFRYFSKK